MVHPGITSLMVWDKHQSFVYVLDWRRNGTENVFFVRGGLIVGYDWLKVIT